MFSRLDCKTGNSDKWVWETLSQLFDHMYGCPRLLTTNHYRVQDWKVLCQSLSGEADVEGSREEGWIRFFEGENGLPLSEGVTIEPGKCSDRVSVTYCTKWYANAGRFWFERIARHAAIFIGREINTFANIVRDHQF